jgi:hypothetical protein
MPPKKKTVKKPVKKPAKKPEKKQSPAKPRSPKAKPPDKPKSKGIVVEMDNTENTECNEKRYDLKLKNLINKIKNQNTFTDNGIRFAWKK